MKVSVNCIVYSHLCDICHFASSHLNASENRYFHILFIKHVFLIWRIGKMLKILLEIKKFPIIFVKYTYFNIKVPIRLLMS